jgi:hypothetical protein
MREFSWLKSHCEPEQKLVILSLNVLSTDLRANKHVLLYTAEFAVIYYIAVDNKYISNSNGIDSFQCSGKARVVHGVTFVH